MALSEISPPAEPYTAAAFRRATERVSLSFFARGAVDLARALLGCVLCHSGVAGTIVETEAYLGLEDLAAHASRGLTERNKVLFGPPGYAYVYLIYGMYECLNISANAVGDPGCVLIRALDPVTGTAFMAERRGSRVSLHQLANGPGKLTRALAITRAHNGIRFDRGSLTIRRWRNSPVFTIGVTPRIGITKCAEWPLRFVWAGHPALSKALPCAK